MKVIIDDLWFCQDCMLFAVNGEPPQWENDAQNKRIVAGVEAFGPHLVHDGTHEDEDEDADEQEFSWRSCDCCGSRLGGSRHRFAVLGEDE